MIYKITRRSILGGMLLIPTGSVMAQRRIIDMHTHAQDLWAEPGSIDARTGRVPANTEEVRKETFRLFDSLGVVFAVVSGPHAEEYRALRPASILASPLLMDLKTPVDSLRLWFKKGRFQALAEFAPQYDGVAPNDPRLEPYFAMAEELDIPVGLHVGPGEPGAPYGAHPRYRMAYSNPLLLEDVLVRHPKLRLYVMHAGWPFINELIGLLYAHPQVFVDTGVIDWYLPRPEFHQYLRRLVEAGFTDRIMFGSDQMVFPGALRTAVQAVESAPFLTAKNKADIFYNNAARFLRLPPGQRR